MHELDLWIVNTCTKNVENDIWDENLKLYTFSFRVELPPPSENAEDLFCLLVQLSSEFSHKNFLIGYQRVISTSPPKIS